MSSWENKQIMFSKHRPSGPMLSISQNVRLSVCLSVCMFVRLFTLEVPFKCFFAPTSRSAEKGWKAVVSDLKILVWNFSKIAAQKKVCLFCWFCLTKHGGNHASRWIRDVWSNGVSLILAYLYTFLSFCVLDDFFRFSKNLVFGYSWATRKPRFPMD